MGIPQPLALRGVDGVVGHLDDISVYMFCIWTELALLLLAVRTFSLLAGPELNLSKSVIVPLFDCCLEVLAVHLTILFGISMEVQWSARCLGVLLGSAAIRYLGSFLASALWTLLGLSTAYVQGLPFLADSTTRMLFRGSRA